MRKTLGPSFFARDARLVARELLGKYLISEIGGTRIEGMITETEAYDGPFDRASHASKGRTSRTEVMFGEPGFFYVYLCYGIHFMLNIVVREREYPAAVLIRGVDTVNGPGRVARAFGVTKAQNGESASPKTRLWVEDRGALIGPKGIKKTPRIGVDYAGPIWSRKHYRFVLKKN